MKAADFLYHRPGSVAEAAALLHDYGGDARILAGGQSLVPMLNLRLWRPAALIDINRIEGLDGIDLLPDATVLGARLRYDRIEHDPRIADRLPLLARMIRSVGDRQVRHRGTVGGAMIQADPTGEMALGALVLGARLRLVSRAGERHVPAEEFFLGSYATAARPDEMLVSIRYPLQPAGFRFFEINRRHNDFAVLSIAVVGDRAADGTWHGLRIGLGGVDETPVLAREAIALAEGTTLDPGIAAAAAEAAAAAISPPDDIRASADYRRHLVTVHLARVLTSLSREGQEDRKTIS